MMKKLAFVLCIVLAINVCAFSFAEEVAVLPEAAEAAETSAPEPTKAPDPTKAPEATKAPEVTKAPEATKAPEITAEPVATAVPEITAEPEATAVPEITAEPEATVEPEATEEPVARSISIKVKAPSELHYGDKITLTATLTGYENVNYTVQWQYSYNGNDWNDMKNANELTYTFKVNEETANTMWRLVVTVID